MVRRTSIRDSLRELAPVEERAKGAQPDATEQVAIPAQATGQAAADAATSADTAADTEDAPPEPARAPKGSTSSRRRAPRKPSAARGEKGGGAKPAARTQDAAAAPAAKSGEAIRVLGVSSSDAKRIGLYLHPDDARALQLARVEDGADANARGRAMIALWRGNPRFQSAVNRLARSAPSTSTEADSGEGELIRILVAEGGAAKRVSLYVHPDDFRALAMARVDDGLDANSRVRAMIALWRAHPRYQRAIDKLARTAPRGGRP